MLEGSEISDNAETVAVCGASVAGVVHRAVQVETGCFLDERSDFPTDRGDFSIGRSGADQVEHRRQIRQTGIIATARVGATVVGRRSNFLGDSRRRDRSGKQSKCEKRADSSEELLHGKFSFLPGEPARAGGLRSHEVA